MPSTPNNHLTSRVIHIALITSESTAWEGLLSKPHVHGGVEIRLTDASDVALRASRSDADPPFDLAILDLASFSGTFSQIFRKLKRSLPELGLLLVVHEHDEPDALKTLSEGVEYFLIKGQYTEQELLRAISVSVIHSKSRFVLRQARDELTASHLRFQAIVDANADGIIILDRARTIRFVNRACEEILCRKASQLLFTPCDFLPVLRDRLEIDLHDPLGRKKTIEIRLNEIEMDGQPHWIASLRDLTELCSLREELKSMTLQDSLTNVCNRRGFFSQAGQLLQIAVRQNCGLAMMFVDLDGLKAINDQFGHMAGDQALIDTAEIMVQSSRKSDVVARIGGDEFVLLCLDNRANTASVVRRRLETILRRFNMKQVRPYEIVLSIGVARQKVGQSLSIEKLLLDSDQSMYQHKRSKRCAV